jgi:hypothetical protein
MNSPALLFKQAVRSAHRAVVVIKVHFERLQAVRNWIECWVCRARDSASYADLGIGGTRLAVDYAQRA